MREWLESQGAERKIHRLKMEGTKKRKSSERRGTSGEGEGEKGQKTDSAGGGPSPV